MGNDPTPLRQEEVKQIMQRMSEDSPVIKVNFKVGQKVRIISGPFNDFPARWPPSTWTSPKSA